MTLQRAILTSLDNVQPRLMPERALWADVEALLPHGASITEVRGKAVALEVLGWVVGITDSEGNRKWRITDNGRAELANR